MVQILWTIYRRPDNHVGLRRLEAAGGRSLGLAEDSRTTYLGCKLACQVQFIQSVNIEVGLAPDSCRHV